MKTVIGGFLFLFFLLSPSLCANVLIQSKNQNNELINVPYFEDKTGQLSFQEVKEKTFVQPKSKMASFGFTKSAYWFKVSVDASEDAVLYKWWLSLSYAMLDKIDLYTCDENSKLLSLRKSGKLLFSSQV